MTIDTIIILMADLEEIAALEIARRIDDGERRLGRGRQIAESRRDRRDEADDDRILPLATSAVLRTIGPSTAMAAPAVMVLDTPMVRSEIGGFEGRCRCPLRTAAAWRQHALRQPFRRPGRLHLDAERDCGRIEQHHAPIDAGIDVLPAHQAEHQEGADADQRDRPESELFGQEDPAEDGQDEDRDRQPARQL